MSAVVLPTVLPAAAARPDAVGKDAGAGGKGFAGVLDMIGARPDPSPRRKSSTGTSDPQQDKTDADDEPLAKKAGGGRAAAATGVVDVSLLAQAALNAVTPGSAGSAPPTEPVAKSDVPAASAVETATGARAALTAGATAPVRDTASLAGGEKTPISPLSRNAETASADTAERTTGGQTQAGPQRAPGVVLDRDAVVAPRSGTSAATSSLPSEPSLEAAAPASAKPTSEQPTNITPAVTPGPAPKTAAEAGAAAPAKAASTSASMPAEPMQPASNPGSTAASSTSHSGGGDRANWQAAPAAAEADTSTAGPRQPTESPATAASARRSGPAPLAQTPTAKAKQMAASDKPGGNPSTNSGSVSSDAGIASAGGAREQASSDQQNSQQSAAQPVFAIAASAIQDGSAAPQPVVQQIATALQTFAASNNTAAGNEASRSTAVSTVTHVASSTDAGVKNLTVELDPGHLGPVSIILRQTGGTVSIHIAVANPETLHMLERDRHMLTAAVAAMGGSPDTLQLGRDTGSGSSSAAAPLAPAATADQPGRQAAFSSDGATTGRQAPNPGRQSGRADQEPSHDDPTSPPAPQVRRLDGSLYL